MVKGIALRRIKGVSGVGQMIAGQVSVWLEESPGSTGQGAG